MGKRDGYAPGTFCWADLAATDAAGARAFYGGLFGWEAEDVAGGEGGAYTMLKLDGDEVCGMYGLEAERRGAGVPAHWFCYVAVEDADEAADRAGELGGSVVGEPRAAADMGRMAVIEDPVGAVVGVWETGSFAGATRVNDVGCMGWNELNAREPEKAADFYGGLFGWEMEEQHENGKLAYVTIRNAGHMNGGIMPAAEHAGDAPPYWMPYFTVASCEAAARKAQELGGRVVAGPMEIAPDSSIAVLADSQGEHGAVFAVFEGEVDE